MIESIDNIDDELDDVNLVNQFEISDAERCITNNLLAVFNGNNYIGTAFIIDNKGTFISAGHNFRNLSIPHKLYWGDKELPYETVHIEYTEQFSYTDVYRSCQDLYIGRIISNDETPHLGLTVIHGMKTNNDLIIIGLKSAKIPIFNKKIFIEPISINKQQFYLYYIKSHITNPQNLASRPIHTGDLRLNYNNIRCLDFNGVKPCEYSGISGGPVCTDGKIIGMVIADMFITIDYILQFLPQTTKRDEK
jgi:hypothetical protein